MDETEKDRQHLGLEEIPYWGSARITTVVN